MCWVWWWPPFKRTNEEQVGRFCGLPKERMKSMRTRSGDFVVTASGVDAKWVGRFCGGCTTRNFRQCPVAGSMFVVLLCPCNSHQCRCRLHAPRVGCGVIKRWLPGPQPMWRMANMLGYRTKHVHGGCGSCPRTSSHGHGGQSNVSTLSPRPVQIPNKFTRTRGPNVSTLFPAPLQIPEQAHTNMGGLQTMSRLGLKRFRQIR